MSEVSSESREISQPTSLEYMYLEDPYFAAPDDDSTPSFDVAVDDEEVNEHWREEVREWSPMVETTELPVDNGLCIETEFYVDNRRRRLRIFRKKIREVRVTFQDLTKPYLVKVSSPANYKKFLGLTPSAEEALTTPEGHDPSELEGLTPEEQDRLREEWSRELARIEDEIATLRTVLQSKIRESSELKRKLGITVWKEITEDVNQGLKNVKESQVYMTVESRVEQLTKAVTEAPAYQTVQKQLADLSRSVKESPVFQKTESVIKSTAEKTTSILGGITAGVTSKLGQMRNSESFRSIEEKVGCAYENVKGKVASRSNSTQSFDEALREANRVGSGATTPIIPEDRVIP